MNKQQSRTTLSRRMLVAGAAAGTVALASAPASAQRCPPAPARTKGPLVWMDLDQTDLDEAYDQSVYAFNGRTISGRRPARNKVALASIGAPERVAYGTAEIERVDIWKTRRPNAPTLIFLHGGQWLGGRSSQVAYIAEVFVKAGAHFVSVDFSNVKETKGDLMPLVDQCRRAVAWTYQNAASFGGDPKAIYLSGFSSGSHLGSCVIITEWEKQKLPDDILKGAILCSGIYDLEPVRLSKRSSYVTIDDAAEHLLSAQRHIDKIRMPLLLAVGTLETPEFQRQSQDFAAALRAAGKQVRHITGPGHNHFEMQESFGNPYGVAGRAALEMMGLTTAV